MNLKGYRKIILFTEALIANCLLILLLELKDSASILAVSAGIVGLLTSAIWGNVKSNNKVS